MSSSFWHELWEGPAPKSGGMGVGVVGSFMLYLYFYYGLVGLRLTSVFSWKLYAYYAEFSDSKMKYLIIEEIEK